VSVPNDIVNISVEMRFDNWAFGEIVGAPRGD
jgi:hypothetical protein